MKKKILIAVGGTGGHIFPAISLAEKLNELHENIDVNFAGGGLGSSPFFSQKKFSYTEVSSGYFPLKKPFTCFKNMGKILAGIWQSFFLLKQKSPQLIVGFGSYHSLTILFAAKLLKIPYVLYESNAYPGKINRIFSKNALITGIQFSLAASFLKGASTLVEMPLRKGIVKGKILRDTALEYYHLDPMKKTLFIFGGSQGAFALNKLIIDLLKCYNGDLNKLQVLHLTGAEKELDPIKQMYSAMNVSFCVKPFEENMEYAWSIADLVIARSGAGTIAEAIEFEVPALFVPYPKATDDHQTKNAEFMVNEVQGAYLFQESKLSVTKISQLLFELLEENPEKLQTFKDAIKKYKEHKSKKDLYSLVTEFIH